MTHENLKKIIYYDAHDLMMKIKCYEVHFSLFSLYKKCLTRHYKCLN